MRKLRNILILAGGDGTRFWPLLRKNFTSFLGKSLLEQIIFNVSPFAQKIVIVSNPIDQEQIKLITAKIKNLQGLPIDVAVQRNETLGQVDAILSSTGMINGEVLILNANDIFDPSSIRKLIAKIDRQKLEFVMTALKIDKYFPGGYLKLSGNRLIGVVEKPAPHAVPSKLYRLVVDYFSNFKNLLDLIKQVSPDSDDAYERTLDKATKSLKSDYLLHQGYWFTLKYPWHIFPMMNHYLSTLKSDEIKVGKNVKISKLARVVGPVFIDDNTIIGDFALVRQSHIGKNCVIGGYSEVTRSYLSDGVWLHRNYVGDSVLGKNVSLGAQAATANFRFDGKTVSSSVGNTKIDTGFIKFGTIIGDNSRIGVNATILPGIKIGKNSIIGPQELVERDIENNVFLFKGAKKNNLPRK